LSDRAITIRHVHTGEELDTCVALQRTIWGETFKEAVPRAILMIAGKLSGVVAGAFDGDRMVGFVFGLTGLREGRLAHWSDMLAVDPSYRDHGIGRQLKAFQREAVLALGVTDMYWTYDPLVARNAHFNLNRLGAEVVEYVTDMYGTTGSTLHGNVATDRFVVRWRLTAPRATPPPPGADDRRVAVPSDADAASVEWPSWRAETRAAFLEAMAEGYRVVAFDSDGARAYYRLARTSS
jgi:predicted GNAT superfamily acetyltransferase